MGCQSARERSESESDREKEREKKSGPEYLFWAFKIKIKIVGQTFPFPAGAEEVSQAVLEEDFLQESCGVSSPAFFLASPGDLLTYVPMHVS